MTVAPLNSKDLEHLGAMLVMNEVEWPEADQKKTWEKMFQKVCSGWLEDQCYLDQEKRFVPPKGCDSHCVWNWDAETADKFLENIGVKKLGLTGAQLSDPVNRDKLEAPRAFSRFWGSSHG